MGAMIGEYGKDEVRNKRLLRGILIVVIGILVLLAVIRVAPMSQKMVILPIKKVQIYGNALVTNKEIVQTINLDGRSSILTFSKGKAGEQLLQDRRLSQVEMAKLYPDTLRIWVREKVKEAALQTGSGTYWISRDGVVLSKFIKTEAHFDYPFITLNENNDDIIKGQRVKEFVVHDILISMGGIRAKYPDFYRTISFFRVEGDGVYIELTNGPYHIYFGHIVNQEKLERLRALLFVLESEYHQKSYVGNTVEIDMSTTHAAVRMREMRNES